MEKLWVKDVEVGQRASSVFLVAKKQRQTGRNGKAFLRITLQDKTGQLDARVWHDAEAVGATFDVNDLVEVEGNVDSFQGRPQLTIEKLVKVEEGDRAEFAWEAPEPQPPQQREARPAGADGMLQQLRSELGKVQDVHVRTLLFSFLDDADVAARLRRAPAAKEIHHAWSGGLLEHILSCVKLAQRLADHYPMADRDLLIAGAFLHDLGKIHELSFDGGNTSYTDEGRLVGHLVMTAQWIHERARSIPGFPRELELHLTHIVLAHHGRLEYGSPKVPMTLEAFLVHELDEIDSRMALLLAHMARSPGDRWAEPTKAYETLLWKGPAPTEEGRRKGAPWKQFRKSKKKRKEKAPQQEAVAAEAALQPGEAGPIAGPVASETKERPERREPRASAEAPRAETGERRGPKILKRAEPGSLPKGGPQKLTFKPFSALTEEPETPGATGELTPPPVPEAAGAPTRPEPEAATTETLPQTGPEEMPVEPPRREAEGAGPDELPPEETPAT